MTRAESCLTPKANRQAGSSTSQANLSEQLGGGPKLLKVERHKDHPMAQIKLNQQETAEQILRLRPSHINGVPVKNWERLSNDPSAFLILWEGGWLRKVRNMTFCSDGFQQNVRGLQSFGLGNFKPEDEGERHFHNLKLHKLWYG